MDNSGCCPQGCPQVSHRLRQSSVPEGYSTGSDLVGTWRREAWTAMVPIVPPKHRPPGSSTLASYLILWEADDWTWAKLPAPPRDPALLRSIGGDIYAVLAQWDLTPLEQMVLSGRQLTTD